MLDQLSLAKKFILLDLINSYYRMRIQKDEEWKTAFWICYGYCKYQVMSFGLFNAPASFQSEINKILAKKLSIFYVIYLDNILIYTKDLA